MFDMLLELFFFTCHSFADDFGDAEVHHLQSYNCRKAPGGEWGDDGYYAEDDEECSRSFSKHGAFLFLTFLHSTESIEEN